MKAELQIILKSLYETMTEATELSYEAQALAWFSSNFNMVSRESEELAELHKTIEQLTKELQVSQEKSVKPVPKSGRIQMTNEEVQMGVDDGGFPVQLQGPPIQDADMTQTFRTRANSSSLTKKNEELRKMVHQIKKGGTVSLNNEESVVITQEMINKANPEEMEQMEQMMSGSLPPIMSGLSQEYDDEDALPAIAESFVSNGATAGRGHSAEDMKTYQKMQQKLIRDARGLGGGGSIGKISR